MKHSVIALSFILPLLGVRTAEALTIRYAIVVGNNKGVELPGGTLPDLLHAEREARALHAKLIDRCSFDGDGSRTLLLLEPTKEQLLSAAVRIAQQMQADERSFGETKKLFAFFFTGHGLEGQLMLGDGLLAREELARVFRTIEADLTIGVFDACYSASLDPGTLLAKGLRPTPGESPFRELPEEVLTAEGSIWFVSSGPNEASYEDRDIGGVFTHFLIEALDRADTDGPGISLERIWSYAQSNTRRYTAARNRAQNPQKIVAKMKERATLYFSFPKKRDASITFRPSAEGTFLLAYDHGHISERIDKPRGLEKSVAVYAGDATLTRVEGGRVKARRELSIEPGSTLVISDDTDLVLVPGLGESVELLSAKGTDGDLRVARLARRSLFAGVSYAHSISERASLAPRQRLLAEARLDHEEWVAELGFGWGRTREQFESWGYEATGVLATFSGGVALDADRLRLAAMIGASGARMEQTYDDGKRKTRWMIEPTFVLSAAYPLVDAVAIRGSIFASTLIGETAGIDSPQRSSWVLGASIGTFVRIF